jgi:hypothetical protein
MRRANFTSLSSDKLFELLATYLTRNRSMKNMSTVGFRATAEEATETGGEFNLRGFE